MVKRYICILFVMIGSLILMPFGAHAQSPIWNSTNMVGGKEVGTNSGRCTSGFIVKYDNGYFATTAGHCSTSSETMFYQGNNFIAPAKLRHMETGPTSFASTDLQLRQVDQLTLRPIVRTVDNSRSFTVMGTSNAGMYQTVCKLGKKTGYTCGDVVAVNAIFRDEFGRVSPETYTVAAMHSEEGD